MPRSRSTRIASRVALVLIVGLVAVLCLSSWLLAAAVGSLTIIAVAIDVMTHAHVEDHARVLDPTPQKITVDLSRRS